MHLGRTLEPENCYPTNEDPSVGPLRD
jgi:hypothetical protein